LHGIRRLVTRQAMDVAPRADGGNAVGKLLDERTLQVERVWGVLAAMAEEGDTTDLAQASVMMSALRAVLG
jgi:hypothetical protein